MTQNKKTSKWIKFYSIEYAKDNLYIDWEDEAVYESESGYYRNKREPVPAIDLELCGRIVELRYEDVYELSDFIEAVYTIKEHPEYYI